MKIQSRRFNFDDIVGLSRNQLRQHYQLYLGYIRLRDEILVNLENPGLSSYEYRGLKNGETYALNGIILHELYFANLGQSTEEPSRRLLYLINRDFGSYENWLADFIRTGKVGRGWSVLAYDYRDDMLHNIMQDAHNEGPVWDAQPLLVLDVYEHAYMIDFGIDKDRYLEVFQENIDWSEVNDRFGDVNIYLEEIDD